METPENATPHGDESRFCGALARSTGKPCRRVKGWGTDHVGQGRCRLHGGASEIQSGRYSVIRRKSLQDLGVHMEADPEPLDVFPELAQARALFVDFINRYDEWSEALLAWHNSFKNEEYGPSKPTKILDIADAYKLLGMATKIVDQIEKNRAANAIDLQDLNRLMFEMGRVVDRHVAPLEGGPEALEAIKNGWLGLRVSESGRK